MPPDKSLGKSWLFWLGKMRWRRKARVWEVFEQDEPFSIFPRETSALSRSSAQIGIFVSFQGIAKMLFKPNRELTEGIPDQMLIMALFARLWLLLDAKSISIIKQISRNVNINWDRLHSPPPSGMDDHETPHVAFECTIAPRLGLKFRDFFRAYSNPPLRFVASEQARNLDGEGERGERNASRASFSLLPFLFAFGFPKKHSSRPFFRALFPMEPPIYT
jgi:hypothetical protein